MGKILISLVQIDVKNGDVERNIGTALDFIEKAAHKKSKIIVLPEMWATGFLSKNIRELSEQYFKKILDLLSYIARREKLIIIGGSIPEIVNGKLFNTCFAINSNGAIIGSYRKIHLFSKNEEDKDFASGEKVSPILTNFGKIGAIICYDIRFPELARKLSLDGIKILFVPAQFPYPRKDQWEILLRARAIENAIFTVGCNRVGKDSLGEYFGGSLISNPYGEIIEEGSLREEIVTAEINLDQTTQAREHIPVYQDRKPDAYL